MKNLTFFILLLVLVTFNNYSQTNWRYQYPQLPNNDFWAVEFLNPDTGWIGGDQGIFLNTTDGGTNWQPIYTDSRVFIRGISFNNPLNGIAVGDNGAVLKSTDGGRSWEKVVSGVTKYLLCVEHSSIDTVWAGGQDGTLLKSVNGGTTWTKMLNGPSEEILSIQFLDPFTGFITGAGGMILKTTDAGNNWITLISGTTSPLWGIKFFNGLLGFAVGEGGHILKTTNGGGNWTILRSDGRRYYSISALDSNNIWVTGDNYSMRTTDKGVSWISKKIFHASHLIAVEARNDSAAVFVGDDGLIVYTNNNGTTWSKFDPPTIMPYFDIKFFSDSFGMCIGQKGLLKTYDAGKTWARFDTDSTSRGVWAGHLLDSNNAWTMVHSGYVRRTTNSGASWQWATADTFGFELRDINFIDEHWGFIVGALGEVFQTYDGGSTWDLKPSVTQNDLNSIYFINDTLGFMTDSYGNVYKTTNTGFTWQSKNIGQAVLFSVKFLNEQFGYITASSGYVFITTNQGATWKSSHTGQQSSLFAAHFISPVYGWVAGADGAILSTSDGGTTWKKHNSNSSHDLESIFSNGKQVWATGDFATIITLVLDDSIVTGYHSEKNLTPVEFKLFQNYPNPFNPSTKVTFSLPEENRVVIKVFNAMGEQVKEIDRGVLSHGYFEQDIDMGTESSGIYFCQVLCTNTISGRTKSLTVKMALMK